MTKPEPIGQTGDLGVIPSFRDGSLYVDRFTPQSAAENAGLMVGDKIVSVNGTKIDSRDGRLRFWDLIAASPNQSIRLGIEREGVQKRFKVKLDSGDVYESSQPFLAMKRFVFAGDQILLANVVDAITHTGDFNPNFRLEEWEKAARIATLNNFEQGWLDSFPNMSNFRLVDRASVDRALSELRFQMTGAVSAEDVKKIGEMAGATYICLVSANRNSRLVSADHFEHTDTCYVRIIEVATGTVVHSSHFSYKQKTKLVHSS
jgi:membrane-associated protease RseP (regulator of RpoE activity)